MWLKERSICSVSLPVTNVDLESQHTLTSLLTSPLLPVSIYSVSLKLINSEWSLPLLLRKFSNGDFKFSQDTNIFHKYPESHLRCVFYPQLYPILLRTWSGAIRAARASSCPGSLQSTTAVPQSKATWWTSVSVVPTSGNPAVTPSLNWSKT